MRQKYDPSDLLKSLVPRQQQLRERIKSYKKLTGRVIKHCDGLLKRPDISDLDSSFIEKTIKDLLKDDKEMDIPRDDKSYLSQEHRETI